MKSRKESPHISTRDLVPGFGAAVRTAREKQNMSLGDLANLTDAGISALSKIEREQRAPSLRLGLAIARALGLSLDAFRDAE